MGRVERKPMPKHYKMKALPESERPYEKFLSSGAQSLSDAELLAIIIKSGTKELTALEVARELLLAGQGNLLTLYELPMEQLCRFPGIGKVKAIQLKAVAELSVRIAKTKRGYQMQLRMPSSVAAYYMERMRHRKTEALIAAFFDAKCVFLGDTEISVGGVSSAYVQPRDIFQKALERNAVFLILLHNHPSGDPTPSKDDRLITSRIQECGAMLGMTIEDHIIIGDNRYFSFREHDMMNA